MCPQCQSNDVRITATTFDHGVDPATNYHDCGTSARFECLRCGCVGDCDGVIDLEAMSK